MTYFNELPKDIVGMLRPYAEQRLEVRSEDDTYILTLDFSVTKLVIKMNSPNSFFAQNKLKPRIVSFIDDVKKGQWTSVGLAEGVALNWYNEQLFISNRENPSQWFNGGYRLELGPALTEKMFAFLNDWVNSGFDPNSWIND